MASPHHMKPVQEHAEDKAILVNGVWQLPPEEEYHTKAGHFSSSNEDEEGDKEINEYETEQKKEPSLTYIHTHAGQSHRLRMKSGAFVADQFKDFPRHPFVINPNEDPTGLLTPADDQMTATFGGLVIGYTGDKPAIPGPTDDKYTYRGFIFKPGSNIGPEYPGDMSMTPYCIPKSIRVRQIENDESRRGQMQARFSPTFTPSFGLHSGDSSKVSYDQPVVDQQKTQPKITDMSDGTTPEGADEAKKDLNVFVFFGKPQPIPPIDCPPIFPTSDETVLDYLDEHNLEMLFQHLVSLCALEFHPLPFEFMADYCDKLIEARGNLTKFDSLVRIFYPTHVAAVYRLFDKQQNGHISLNQYRLGMEVLGLNRFTPDPEGCHIDEIKKETFYDEGCRGLEVLLRSFMA